MNNCFVDFDISNYDGNMCTYNDILSTNLINNNIIKIKLFSDNFIKGYVILCRSNKITVQHFIDDIYKQCKKIDVHNVIILLPTKRIPYCQMSIYLNPELNVPISNLGFKTDVTNIFDCNFVTTYQIFIKNFKKQIYIYDVKPHDTIESIKQQIENKEGMPINQQKLYYNSEQLDDEHTLLHYNIMVENTILLNERTNRKTNNDLLCYGIPKLDNKGHLIKN
jgi:hypothetical protein